MKQYKTLELYKRKYADKIADYFYQNEANNYAPQYQKEALRKLKQWALRDGNFTEMQRALDYAESASNPMIQHAHKKIHGKFKSVYKSIVAGSLAIPLLFNVANANCNLECNVKKDSAYEIVEDANNPLKIPLPNKDNFKYRHTNLEDTPQGLGVFVYDGYSINNPKKEKIDYVIKSQVVFELPEPNVNDENKNKPTVYLVPFQYMWIDKEDKPKVAIDYDGKINGNEIDITEQFKERMKQLLEQKEINPFGFEKNKKVDI